MLLYCSVCMSLPTSGWTVLKVYFPQAEEQDVLFKVPLIQFCVTDAGHASTL